MTGIVADFVHILEKLAPPSLAESWDHVGLQIGSRNWPVNKVWIALDPLPDVVARACENGVNLLVTHHPLFFKPVKVIDCESTLGRIVQLALTRQLAIYSAHTNLDSVSGGVNDVLAVRIGLNHTRALVGHGDNGMRKLVLFVPSTHVQVVLDTLFTLGVGRIDDYSCCTFRSEGIGTFLAGEGAKPAVGIRGALTEVRENRLEVLVADADLDIVVDAVKKVHPYESVAYDVYPLINRDPGAGLGRVGELDAPVPLHALANKLKTVLKLPTVKVAGRADMLVERVAICSGSGSGLVGAAIASGAQAYVSGDLGYHLARDAQQIGMGIIDVGHFASEHLIIEILAARIREAAGASGLTTAVEAVDLESDPFEYL